jgi:hypothetical protein
VANDVNAANKSLAARRHLVAAISCLDDLGLHQAAAHADLALATLDQACGSDPGLEPCQAAKPR